MLEIIELTTHLQVWQILSFFTSDRSRNPPLPDSLRNFLLQLLIGSRRRKEMQKRATHSRDRGFRASGHLDGKIPFTFISGQAVLDPFVLWLN